MPASADQAHRRRPQHARIGPGQDHEADRAQHTHHPQAAPAHPDGPGSTEQRGEHQGEVRAGDGQQVGQPAGAEVVGHLVGQAPVVAGHQRRHQVARRRPPRRPTRAGRCGRRRPRVHHHAGARSVREQPFHPDQRGQVGAVGRQQPPDQPHPAAELRRRPARRPAPSAAPASAPGVRTPRPVTSRTDAVTTSVSAKPPVTVRTSPVTTTLASTTACWAARSGTGPAATCATRSAATSAAAAAAISASAPARCRSRAASAPATEQQPGGQPTPGRAAEEQGGRHPCRQGGRDQAGVHRVASARTCVLSGAVGARRGPARARRRRQRGAPAHTVTRSRMSARVTSPMPSTSSSSSTLVNGAVGGAPVEDRLGGHRADAGQRVELLEGRGVDVDRSRRPAPGIPARSGTVPERRRRSRSAAARARPRRPPGSARRRPAAGQG